MCLQSMTGQRGGKTDDGSISRLKSLEEAVSGLQVCVFVNTGPYMHGLADLFFNDFLHTQTITKGFLSHQQSFEQEYQEGVSPFLDDLKSTSLMTTSFINDIDGDDNNDKYQGTLMASSSFYPQETSAAKRLERLNDLLDFAAAEDNLKLKLREAQR